MGQFYFIKSLVIRLLNFLSLKNSFSVLNYHRILPNDAQHADLALTPETFEQQLIWLKRHFTIVSLPQALLLANTKQLPANTVVITVDDGFYDCYQFAFPLLLKHQLTATFFITTSGIECGSIWEDQIMTALLYAKPEKQQVSILGQTFCITDKMSKLLAVQQITELVKYQTTDDRKALINDLKEQTSFPKHPVRNHMFITAEQIQHMHKQGMTIGAHTMHHPILTLEKDDIAWQEIQQSKVFLEHIINEPIEFFAYPNGKAGIDFNQSHVKMVESAGFSAAFCTDWGVANIQQDSQFMLKRFTPWDKDPARFCLRLALSALSERYGFGWLRDKVRQNTI